MTQTKQPRDIRTFERQPDDIVQIIVKRGDEVLNEAWLPAFGEYKVVMKDGIPQYYDRERMKA